jgi:RNA-directed DNA polymerase
VKGLDIKGFFDNLAHQLMMRAVKKHTDCPWVLLYVERWLKAPIQKEDGTLENRDKGTPQGGGPSGKYLLHHAFDEWMRQNHPQVSFERYADDVLVHCEIEKQAKLMHDAIEKAWLSVSWKCIPKRHK